MKTVWLIALFLTLVCIGCNRAETAQPTEKPTEQPYVVLEAHASTYVWMPESERGPKPSRYVIQHGNAIMQAHCGVLARWTPGSKGGIGRYDDCVNFPDPIVPVGKPLVMARDSYGL